MRVFRFFKEAGSFVLYSLLRRQHPAAAAAHNEPARMLAAAAPSEVMCVALLAQASRTSPLLASGAQDGSVCLWDSSSGVLLQRLEAHEPGGRGWVMALLLARHEDGRSGLMLSASYDHTVRVWLRAADDLAGGVMSSSSYPSGLGGGSGANGSGGWTLLHTLNGHTDGVLALEISRQRRHAFSSSNDTTVRVWELQRGACLHVLNDHSSSVAAIGWHLASGCLATGAEDGTIHLWDASGVDGARGGADMAPEPPRVVQSLCIEHCEILCITPSADGTALFCGLEEGSMALLSSHSD